MRSVSASGGAVNEWHETRGETRGSRYYDQIRDSNGGAFCKWDGASAPLPTPTPLSTPTPLPTAAPTPTPLPTAASASAAVDGPRAAQRGRA